MKSALTITTLILAAALLKTSCGRNDQLEASEAITVDLIKKDESESNAEWDEKLVAVANLMQEQKQPTDLIDYVRAAAINADTVYPYLLRVMAGNAIEEKKSASLFLFTTGFMLVSNGHSHVPSNAQKYINSPNEAFKSAEMLLENQDLVPTYKNYLYTIDK